MKNKLILIIISITLIISLLAITLTKKEDIKTKIETNKLTATVISITNDKVTIKDNNNIIYTFNKENKDYDIGSNIIIEYIGILNKNIENQQNQIISSVVSEIEYDENGIPLSWQDNGIFSRYYIQAYNKLKTLSLSEKIGQLLLVRYNDNALQDIKKYKLSGFVFFEKDFKNKTKKEVQDMINNLQKASNIPLLTAVDEEGGKVTRISNNTNLVSTPFKSSQKLYDEGGFEKIKEDTIYKSEILEQLGLNVNLAPVVDVSTNTNDYIYERSFGKNTELTSIYAQTVIKASNQTNVSYTLKHFPGYSSNPDTHNNNIIEDNRTITDIETNDLPPFKSAIDEGAQAVLVSHLKIMNIDSNNVASLSSSVHNLLRNELGFTGIIMTDNIDMISTSNTAVNAILSGNDLIITSDYQTDISNINLAIDNGTLDEETIDKLAFRVLAWKYYKGLIFEK